MVLSYRNLIARLVVFVLEHFAVGDDASPELADACGYVVAGTAGLYGFVARFVFDQSIFTWHVDAAVGLVLGA